MGHTRYACQPPHGEQAQRAQHGSNKENVPQIMFVIPLQFKVYSITKPYGALCLIACPFTLACGWGSEALPCCYGAEVLAGIALAIHPGHRVICTTRAPAMTGPPACQVLDAKLHLQYIGLLLRSSIKGTIIWICIYKFICSLYTHKIVRFLSRSYDNLRKFNS